MNFLQIKNKIVAFFSLKKIYILYFVITLATSIQVIVASIGSKFTRYNNYLIFKHSFQHLLENKNLYILYNNEYFDLYKYSPSFAFLMGFFNIFPDWLGVFIFNLIGILTLLIAVNKIHISNPNIRYILLFIFIEMGISLSSTQTNIFIAGVSVLIFSLLKNKNYFIASLCLVLSFYIKIYGILVGILFLLDNQRIKLILYSIFWIFIIGIIPLIIIKPDQLILQYQNWMELLKMDHSNSLGASIQIILIHDLNIPISKLMIVIIGLIFLLIPLIRISLYNSTKFQLYYLCSILIWLVIFNHKAESPTYIIAMLAIAIFYVNTDKSTALKIIMLLCLLFTSFSSTDLITPAWINEKWIEPLAIKAIFPTIIWFYIQRQLICNPAKYFLA